MLLGLLKLGRIHELREIFEQYDVPMELGDDPDIQWELRNWRYILDNPGPDHLLRPEPDEETRAFLDSKFPKKD